MPLIATILKEDDWSKANAVLDHLDAGIIGSYSQLFCVGLSISLEMG
jgi:hypothetical protein